MISIEDYIVTPSKFPDGTMLLKLDFGDINFDKIYIKEGFLVLNWYYENDAEIITLYMVAKHLRENGFEDLALYMPYLPNARQDRVKNNEDVFTLKYFCEFINSLNFKWVHIFDAHSAVGPALLNNCINENPRSTICNTLNLIKDNDELLIFYPDEGAMKRYSQLISLPYAFGVKRRNWETGKIESLDVIGGDSIKGKNILIIDDICSRGGTFYHSAKALKELGANKIYLYITHCENTILEGDLLESGLIEEVFTTNSIFTKEHKKINVIEI